MDGRRHSVDIPISKTLLTLRRVRSLRDPSTNSLSKLSAFVDNLNWESNLNGGSGHGCLVNFDALGSRDVDLHRRSGDYVTDYEMFHGPNMHNSRLGLSKNSGWAGSVPVRTVEVEEPSSLRSDEAVVCENKFLSERYCSNYRDKGLDLTCMTPASDYLEGVGSCNEPIEESLNEEKGNRSPIKRKSRYRKHFRSSKPMGGDVMSRVSSPCLSLSDIPMEESSHGMPLYGNEEIDGIDPNQCGCGISYCWSRTPRLRDSNLSSDVEEHPLLSGETGVSLLDGQRKSDLKHIYNEIIPYSDSPRSLSQKFRPKSFNDLIGQGSVAQSLLSAVVNGRINPFYIFHGPRGTGKTSASRIFAAAVNCLSHEDNKPCGLCQECALFFSGRSRDVMEVDSVSINREERVRYLIKNAMLPPISSRFKIFIVDECQLLKGATWATLVNHLEELSRHVIFIMITPDLSKLPRSAVSRSQRYHFPKIKEADIVERLGRICTEEGFDYDLVALDFIAAKSNGSLRDAEMMLEQLSLLGKRITISLAYELIGIVSDDELLELLALALSSDTSNTVKRAREMMRSRIDPMQLISQLANIIMDILAGKCLDGASDVKRQFFERHCSEADMQQLNHALKVLSETEKQLRASKNQTTWLTVALLQLSSVGSAFADANASSLCMTSLHPRDGDFCSTSSTGDSRKHLVPCPCKVGLQDDKGTLESIWNRATEKCESVSLGKILRKQGKLASLSFKQGLAVAELEFSEPDYVSKAEKSWKLIASALQATLGCNVEIRINLVSGSVRKYAKVKGRWFSLFSCSRRMRRKSDSTAAHGNSPSVGYVVTSEQPFVRSGDTFSSDGASQVSHCCHRNEHAKTIRNSDGNALSMGITQTHCLRTDSKKEDESSYEWRASSAEEPEKQPGCFPRAMKSNKKLQASDTSRKACLGSEPEDKLALSITSITPSEACYCTGDPYIICSFCKNYASCGGADRQRTDSKVHCWRTPPFPFRKAWQLRQQQQGGTHLVEWVLPCAAAVK